MRRWWAAWGLAVLVLGACGDGDDEGRTAQRTLTGTVLVRHEALIYGVGQSCTGTEGFSDIRSGTPVTVRDEANKILAVGQLGASRSILVPPVRRGDLERTNCEFDFSVGPIPDRPFYQVEVANRGPLSYSRADLETKGWRLELSLG